MTHDLGPVSKCLHFMMGVTLLHFLTALPAVRLSPVGPPPHTSIFVCHLSRTMLLEGNLRAEPACTLNSWPHPSNWHNSRRRFHFVSFLGKTFPLQEAPCEIGSSPLQPLIWALSHLYWENRNFWCAFPHLSKSSPSPFLPLLLPSGYNQGSSMRAGTCLVLSTWHSAWDRGGSQNWWWMTEWILYLFLI